MTLELSNHNAPPAAPAERLIVRPHAAHWADLLSASASRALPIPSGASFRDELGLPSSAPLIMTGHQAEFWHPGILAKYLAADAAAQATSANIAWLFVDQDQSPAVGVRFPVQNAGGRLAVGTLEYTASGRITRFPDSGELPAPYIESGLRRIDAAMDRFRSEPNLARRIARALADLVAPLLVARRPPPAIFATQLSRTSLFQDLIQRMARAPERTCETYNAAVAHHPSAKMRPLLVNDIQDQYELPLWHITPSGVRRRVYAEMLPSLPPEELAPRALLMTGLLRLAGCDLFIHGTGGGGDEAHEGYDRITEEWFSAWLGIAQHDLAPVAVVTATRLLPLRAEPPPTPSAVARARWLAHHARHNPAAIGNAQAAERKRELIHQIKSAPDTAHRATLFQRLHETLDDYRRAHRRHLAELETSAQSAAHTLREADILLDRTWPFPIYPPAVIADLQTEIRATFPPEGAG